MASSPFYQIILLGEVGVGKTSLFTRISKDAFLDEKDRVTVGLDFHDKEVNINGQDIQVRLTDTGGGERFRTLTAGYYRQANAVILVYSVDTVSSLSHLQEWIEDCINNNSEPDNLLWVLVGNKADLPNEVPTTLVEGLCDQFGIRHFFYTSAKSGDGVEKMFNGVIKATHKAATKEDGTLNIRQSKQGGTGSDSGGNGNRPIHIRKTDPNSGKKCC